MSEAPPSVRVVSSKTIHLSETKEEGRRRRRWELTVWDLTLLSVHYIQKGLLFTKPPEPLDSIIPQLQTALSDCLCYFYPLAGRLATDPETTTFVDCNDAGAEFVVAQAHGVYIADLVTDKDIPLHIVRAFFPFDKRINYDGHSLPLVAIQVTELSDGVFIGCSLNHAIGDGESLWHFINSWSELSVGKPTISRPPLLDRPQIHKELGPIRLVLAEEDMERYEPPLLRERFFRFSGRAVSRVKAMANQQGKPEKGEISSLQALVSLMWRCITRARKLPAGETVECRIVAGNRRRVDPPLPRDYFGNSLQFIGTTAKVEELLSRDLGWAARTVHEAVASYTNQAARESLEGWVKNPRIARLGSINPLSVVVASSPRFDMYASDFGWGKGIAVLSGSASKFDGKISCFPGCDGDGAIDLDVTLLPHVMLAMEDDEELLDALHPK